MKKLVARVSTPRSPQEVYDYLVDFERHPEWRFDVVESKLVDGETGRVGARYRQRIKPGRREFDSEVVLTEADPGRRIGFRSVEQRPVTASGAYEINNTGSGTEIVTEVILETRGLAKLIEPLMGPQLRKTSARYEQALAERLR